MTGATDPGAPAPIVDWADVQGEVAQPYADDVATHLFLNFPDAASGVAFLSAIKGRIATGDRWQEAADSHRNIGFTFAGLAALALPATELASFPFAFSVGMAGRAAVLGDTGASAPATWQAPFGRSAVHAWVMVSAPDAARRDVALAEVEAMAKNAGIDILLRDEAANFPGEGNRTKEHFGFNDGIGQPAIAGAPGPSWPGQGTPGPDASWLPLSPGAFVLGYPNEMGYDPPFPRTMDLRRNGTFMAYRKLDQHVPLFRQYLADNAALLGGDAELLAAKMIGRWRSGAPLELAPDHDDPSLGKDDQRNNDFRYAEDAGGTNVPHLSHIRRANPRDGLPADSVVQARLHRIIRRKMPYGPMLASGAADDGVARGIIFRVYNADLVSQFEMVQAQWMGSGNDAGGLSTDQDVVAGLTDPPSKGENRLGSTFPIPRGDDVKTLYNLPRFVTMRGGEYLFLPGIKALDWIIDHANGAGAGA